MTLEAKAAVIGWKSMVQSARS